jgi:hypothetical protein
MRIQYSRPVFEMATPVFSAEGINMDGQDEQDGKTIQEVEISNHEFLYPVHPVHPCLNLL